MVRSTFNQVAIIFSRSLFITLFSLSVLILNHFYFIPPALSQTPAGEDVNQLQKATQFLFSGKLKEAEEAFLLALKLNPKLHRAHYGLGLVYLQTNRPDQADTSFRSALAIQPDYAPAYRGLGQAAELKNDLPGAVSNYQKAVSLEKVNPAFANDVAIARFRLSQIGESPEQALEVRKRGEEGTRLLKAGKKEEALKEFQAVLEMAPRQLEALENGAVIFSELNRFEESAGYLKRLLAVDPAILFAHYLLGANEEAVGKIGEAWDQYQTVVQLGGKSPQNKDVVKAKERIEQLGATREIAAEADRLFQEAGKLFQKGEREKGEGAYREVLKLVPEHLPAKFGLGNLLYQTDKSEEAKKLFLEVEVKDPSLFKVHFFLGKIYFRNQEIQKGWEEMTRAVELGKLPANAGTFKAEIEEAKRMLAQFGNDLTRALQIQKLLEEGSNLWKKESFDAALAKFNEVLSLSPENPDALAALGTIYTRETFQDPAKAREMLEKAIAANPDLLLPRIQIGLLDESQEDYEGALAQYREVIQREKDQPDVAARAKKLIEQAGGTPERARELHLYLKNGEKLAQEKKWDEAAAEYQKALEMVPGQIYALYFLALADIELKKPVEAEKRLQTLLKVDPEHLDGHLQLGLLLGARGEYEEGVKELEKVISIGKEGKQVQTAKKELDSMKKKADAEAHFKAGMESMARLDELEKKNPSKPGERIPPDKMELIEKGIKEMEAAVKLNADNPYYFYNLGYAYVLKFELVSAELMFKLALTLKPDLLIAHYRLAVIYDIAGATDFSIKEYEKVVALGKPEDEEVKTALSKIPLLKAKAETYEEAKGYALIGALYMEQKNFEKAGPLLKKAAELHPGNGDYWYQLGVYHEAVNEPDQAAYDYSESIKASPNFSRPYFYLGVIQEKKGKVKEAYENFKKSKQYLADPKSAEAGLIQGRLDFYEKKLTGSLSFSLFNFDSNIGSSADAPQSEIYAVYGLDLRYFHYKSLKFLFSSDFSAFNALYYYLQYAFNSDTYSLEARWIDLHGFEVTLGSSGSVNFSYGGFTGWNSQVKMDLVKDAGWFDSFKTHLDYVYSISALNPFFDSVRQDLSWTLAKSKWRGGSLTLGFGLTNLDVVAQDNSSLAWSASWGYSYPVTPLLTGSVGGGAGQTFFKNPDSSAFSRGLGVFYRKNLNLNVSTSLGYTLYKNVSLSGSAGWQMVSSNTEHLFTGDTADILSKQTSPIGSYRKVTLGLTLNYLF